MESLAERLVGAESVLVAIGYGFIGAGEHDDLEIFTNDHGQTYVAGTWELLGRETYAVLPAEKVLVAW